MDVPLRFDPLCRLFPCIQSRNIPYPGNIWFRDDWDLSVNHAHWQVLLIIFLLSWSRWQVYVLCSRNVSYHSLLLMHHPWICVYLHHHPLAFLTLPNLPLWRMHPAWCLSLSLFVLTWPGLLSRWKQDGPYRSLTIVHGNTRLYFDPATSQEIRETSWMIFCLWYLFLSADPRENTTAAITVF